MADPTQSQPKMAWQYDRNLTDAERRNTRALEYIAYILDRIEGHLDRLASAAETGSFNESVRKELSAISHVLPKLVK
jgi:hypothetical protein